MSLGYAEKLSYREDLGGRLGDPELHEPAEAVEEKVAELAHLVAGAARVVAFTGAGISTSCGIPDFRGPNGVWTAQRQGKPMPQPKTSFALAKPSLTHQALAALMESGKLTYLVSQNVDSLHLRSGVPRAKIAELHGNCFAERCAACSVDYLRDFEVETVGFKRTGRRCVECKGSLKDFVLDWEDALPEEELKLSEEHAKHADLAICLGTSLQITPACDLPLRTVRKYKGQEAGGKLAIINLQGTKHDKKAVASGGVVIHGRTDDVMRSLMQRLGMPIPPYVRRDTVALGHVRHAPAKRKAPATGPEGEAAAAAAAEPEPGGEAAGPPLADGDSSSSAAFSVYLQSSHGPKCPMPMVQRVEFEFEDPSLKGAVLEAPPFVIRRTARAAGRAQVVAVRVVVHLHEAADPDKRRVELRYDLDLASPAAQQAASFESQRVEYHQA